MAEFILHTIPGSPFARSVSATLEEKGAAYRIVRLAPGALKQEPHLSRHPFGRMPAFEHGDFKLYETQAILRYLDRVLPEPPLTPRDARAAARMDQVMGVNDWYLFPGCASVIVFQRVVGPAVIGLTPDEAVIAEAMPRAQVVLNELSRLLGDGPWFAGADFSLADLTVGPQLDMFAATPEWASLTAGLGNLAPWLERIRARPSFQETTWEKTAQRAA